jgi:hypothetical protein
MMYTVQENNFMCSTTTIIIGMAALYGPLSSLDFLTTGFLEGGAITARPATNLEDQASVFVTPRDRATQLYPQALGTHFSCSGGGDGSGSSRRRKTTAAE